MFQLVIPYDMKWFSTTYLVFSANVNGAMFGLDPEPAELSFMQDVWSFIG